MRITNDAKRATRRRILDAARRLFARDGFDGAATRDLAREAGIAAGTLFNYFPTKEAVAMSLAAEALGEARDSCDRKRRGEESLEEDLFAFVAAGLRSLKPLRGCLRPVLEGALSPLAAASAVPDAESLRNDHLETVGTILARHGQAEPPVVTMHLYWTLYTGVLAFWLGDASPHQEDTLAVLDQALKMFVHSLPPSDPSAASAPRRPLMNPNLGELLAALPAVEDDADERLDAALLQRLIDRLGRRRVPQGPLHRLGALGALQAQIFLAYAAWWVRSWFRSAERNEQALLETHLRVAVQLYSGMSYLRGAVMKIGQTLANLPNVVPDEIVDTLEHLHFQAPPMHFALLREHVRNELGGDPEEVFASFETRAFAAASLGQVHRCRPKSGEDAAVKVQYPGMGMSVRSDFRNLFALMLPLRVSKDWDNLKARLPEDLRRVLELETDYEKEAEFQRKARSLFREDDRIVVPRVYEQHSTRRVLTMELLSGVHINDFLAGNPPQERRDHFGALIVRAWDRLFFAGHVNYADLHPGNFLFMPDGRLGLLDFGCVRPFSDSEWELIRLAMRAMDGSREDLLRYMKRSVALAEDAPMDPEHQRLLERLIEWTWRPGRCRGPFDFGDGGMLREGVEIFRELSRKRFTRSEPLCVLSARMFLGLFAMLYRLRARVDRRAIGEDEARAAGEEVAE